MLLAFTGFLASFMTPIQQIIGLGQAVQEMQTQMERVEDVLRYPVDVPEEPEEAVSVDELDREKLRGEVDLKGVTFGYSPLEAPLIEDFSLTLAPGKRVALVGGSGSGKSTIAKMIAGIYQPWSGEVLFDGKRIDEIPRAVFKGSLTMVDQQVVLFHDSIENNIKMWDDTIEDFEMVLSARDAGIHQQIVARKGGYKAMVEEGGRNLSGGERQRIEIARIIVAHRLSTIRDCDEIIVLDRGKVAQRGTHDELMAEEGLYMQLIKTA